MTDKGTAPPASDTLIVNLISDVVIGKSFDPTTIGAGGVSLLTITVDNLNTGIAIPVAFSDFLPLGSAGGQMLVAPLPLLAPPLINTCGGTLTAPAGSSSVIYAGGLLPKGPSSCQVTVWVTAPVAGNYINLLGTASVTLTVSPTPAQPGLLLEKTAIPLTYTKVGDIIAYTYIITNIGGVTLTGPFKVTDDNFSATLTSAGPQRAWRPAPPSPAR